MSKIKIKLEQFKSCKNRVAKMNLNFSTVCFVIYGLLILTGIAYLVQTNQTATQGYNIKHLEDKLTDLRAQNEIYQKHIAELESLNRIEVILAKEDMNSSQQMKYFNDLTAVAKK